MTTPDFRSTIGGTTLSSTRMIKVVQVAERIKGTVSKAVARPEGELCKERARAWVHAYAAGGAAFAFVPIPVPGSTTAGLVALETTMVHVIGKIYGDPIETKDAAALVAGLEVAGGALKTVTREVAGLIPVVGWAVRGVVAAGAIEAIGNTVIAMYEKRFPDRACTS